MQYQYSPEPFIPNLLFLYKPKVLGSVASPFILLTFLEQPKPSISWKFNNTNAVQPVSEEEYKILHAIHSDTGLYTCIAKNKYGETKKDIFVRVLTLPVIKKEIIVKTRDNLELPCIDDRGISGVTYIWQKNNELVSQDMIQSNGSILLDNIRCKQKIETILFNDIK